MNYVDWCVKVLDALWQEHEKGGDPSHASIATTLFGVPYSFLGMRQEAGAIRQATFFLADEGLIDAHSMSGHFHVGAAGRDVLDDPSSMWRDASKRRLTDDERVLLGQLNELSHRQADKYAWIERARYDQLAAAWGAEVGVDQRNRVLGSLQGLKKMDMLYSRTSDTIQSTFAGVAKQFKPEQVAVKPSQESLGSLTSAADSALRVQPIYRGRSTEIDMTLCFVLMPLHMDHEDRYRNGFIPAIKEAGLTPKRADDIYDNRAVMEDVWDHICRARVVVADLTGLNANVCYELGIAHTLGKEVVLVLPDGTTNPFDIGHLRQVRYRDVAGGETKLVTKLTATLRTILSRMDDA